MTDTTTVRQLPAVAERSVVIHLATDVALVDFVRGLASRGLTLSSHPDGFLVVRYGERSRLQRIPPLV